MAGQTGPPNMAIVSDVQENIPRVLSMVKQLDKPIKNINIAVNSLKRNLIHQSLMELTGQTAQYN